MGLFANNPAVPTWLMMGTMHGANTPTVRPYGRLKLIGAGLALALVGMARMLRGIQVVNSLDWPTRVFVGTHCGWRFVHPSCSRPAVLGCQGGLRLEGKA